MNIEISSQSIEWALMGGAIIGSAAALLLLTNGRMAGISGIVGRAFNFKANDISWRLFFAAGLVTGGFCLVQIYPQFFVFAQKNSFSRLAIAGVLVGFGSRLGSGCTSGHGICGISRLSKRSIAATITFIITGMLTVYLLKITEVTL
jgi:uncharacterized membrane protein YedE/YeeE